MDIKSITLQNFKGIHEKATIPLAPITLLFGANSTGKSSILHAFLYLYEILVNRDCDPEYSSLSGERVYLGGFKNLVHNKNIKNSIVIGAALNLEEDLGVLDNYLSQAEEWVVEEGVADYPDATVDRWSFEIEIEWSKFEKKPFISRFECFSHGKRFSLITKRAGATVSFINDFALIENWVLPESLELLGEYVSEENWQDVGLEGQDHALPDIHSRIQLNRVDWDWNEMLPSAPQAARLFSEAAISQACLAPLKMLIKRLEQLFYIGPLRVIPDANFSCVQSPQKARWYDGSAAWDLFASGSDRLRSDINDWFASRVGFSAPYVFEPVHSENGMPDRSSVVVRSTDTNIPHYLNGLGAGVSQVFPFVTGVCRESSGIMACEQPELHIHPRWQLVLADMMLANTKTGFDKMFLIETHSEHLMLRLLKRRRETAEGELEDSQFACEKNDVQIVFCEQDEGKTLLRAISTTDEGEFDAPWPNGFFHERRGELF